MKIAIVEYNPKFKNEIGHLLFSSLQHDAFFKVIGRRNCVDFLVPLLLEKSHCIFAQDTENGNLLGIISIGESPEIIRMTFKRLLFKRPLFLLRMLIPTVGISMASAIIYAAISPFMREQVFGLEINWLAVNVKHQSKGIGSKLLKQARVESPDLWAKTLKGQNGAVGFYEYHGFRKVYVFGKRVILESKRGK